MVAGALSLARRALAGLVVVCAWAQAPQLKQAGVCARCHVAQVLEWSVAAKHGAAGTNCAACHGPSAGHVANERNQVKPDRLPVGMAAITGLCASCHAADSPEMPAPITAIFISCLVGQNKKLRRPSGRNTGWGEDRPELPPVCTGRHRRQNSTIREGAPLSLRRFPQGAGILAQVLPPVPAARCLYCAASAFSMVATKSFSSGRVVLP